MFNNRTDTIAGGLIALLVGLFALCIYLSIAENREWEAFRASHDCKVVGHMKGRAQTGFGVGIGSNGAVPTVVTVSDPSRTGWLCDDGVTYWR